MSSVTYSFMDVSCAIVGPGLATDCGNGSGASEEGITIAAGTVGKWKLGAQVAAISCLILGPQLDHWLFLWTKKEIFRFFIQLNRPYSFFTGCGVLLLWAAVILALWSAAGYFRDFWRAVGPKLMEGGRLMSDGDDVSGGDA